MATIRRDISLGMADLFAIEFAIRNSLSDKPPSEP